MSQVQTNPVLCTDMYIYATVMLASYSGRSCSLITRLWSSKPYAEFNMLMTVSSKYTIKIYHDNFKHKSLINVLCLENPSCLHTTLASATDHKLSQTVPQVSLKQISTRPEYDAGPSTSRTSPFWQRPKKRKEN